ncbi:unnamed protein product [Didymodactylos carnosus]|uniref:Beta-1,4-galactosyltransferase n=1 Tax=Didymodactylos carnosus TaxID=1234261 RepID=A0A813Y6B5_9BILA|nr:unnamed protein product [Didymodactylos carnosus]CAF3664153.1 unnamed protein product [Didymodactylos carnosus]
MLLLFKKRFRSLLISILIIVLIFLLSIISSKYPITKFILYRNLTCSISAVNVSSILKKKEKLFEIPNNSDYLVVSYRSFILRTSIGCIGSKNVFKIPKEDYSKFHPSYSKYLNGTFSYLLPNENITYNDIDNFYFNLTNDKRLKVPLNMSFVPNSTFTNIPYLYRNGMWEPAEVISSQRTAILVPLQGRDYNAKTFLFNMHAFLRRQLLTYAIYFVNQIYPLDRFNKGRLYNLAIKYIRRHSPEKNITCFILHDVDLLPEHDQNFYICETNPKHTTSRIRKAKGTKYAINYEFLIGGVLMLTFEQYMLINGFSNQYWNWGGEDDDVSLRIIHKEMCVVRPPLEHAKYISLPHLGQKPNLKRFELLRWTTLRMSIDGYSNIDKYAQIVKAKQDFAAVFLDAALMQISVD